MSSGETYSPAWWLPGGHLQTLWGKLRRGGPAITLCRRRIPTPDGDEIELLTHDGGRGSPHLLLLHGLEGSPESHYVTGLLACAADAGWTAHLLLFRSCGGKQNLTPRFYHSGDTADVRLIIGQLSAEFPARPICVAGISLGGNVLLKLLGESGAIPENLRAAAAVSVPYDLARSASRINRGFSRVYQRLFLGTLKEKLLQKRKSFAMLPSEAALRKLNTMVEFDELVTAPLHGFDGAADYYQKSSAIRYLAGIRVPTLLLSAFDDPFLPSDVLRVVETEARANVSLLVEFHRRGGHVGFVGGRFPWRPTYYAERRILEFFGSVLKSC